MAPQKNQEKSKVTAEVRLSCTLLRPTARSNSVLFIALVRSISEEGSQSLGPTICGFSASGGGGLEGPGRHGEAQGAPGTPGNSGEPQGALNPRDPRSPGSHPGKDWGASGSPRGRLTMDSSQNSDVKDLIFIIPTTPSVVSSRSD